MDSIGEIIHARRRDIGLTQSEVGARAGLHQSTVSDIENDKYVPPWATRRHLEKALALPAEALEGAARRALEAQLADGPTNDTQTAA